MLSNQSEDHKTMNKNATKSYKNCIASALQEIKGTNKDGDKTHANTEDFDEERRSSSSVIEEVAMDQLTCPITMCEINDPVYLSDGNFFEKSFLIDWVRQQGNCPMTRKPLTEEEVEECCKPRNEKANRKKAMKKIKMQKEELEHGEKIDQLVKLGYTKDQVFDALRRYDYDQEGAANYLIDQHSKKAQIKEDQEKQVAKKDAKSKAKQATKLKDPEQQIADLFVHRYRKVKSFNKQSKDDVFNMNLFAKFYHENKLDVCQKGILSNCFNEIYGGKRLDFGKDRNSIEKVAKLIKQQGATEFKDLLFTKNPILSTLQNSNNQFVHQHIELQILRRFDEDDQFGVVALVAYKHSQNNTLGNPFAKYLGVALNRLCYDYNKLLIDYKKSIDEESKVNDAGESMLPDDVKKKLVTLVHVIQFGFDYLNCFKNTKAKFEMKYLRDHAYRIYQVSKPFIEKHFQIASKIEPFINKINKKECGPLSKGLVKPQVILDSSQSVDELRDMVRKQTWWTEWVNHTTSIQFIELFDVFKQRYYEKFDFWIQTSDLAQKNELIPNTTLTKEKLKFGFDVREQLSV